MTNLERKLREVSTVRIDPARLVPGNVFFQEWNGSTCQVKSLDQDSLTNETLVNTISGHRLRFRSGEMVEAIVVH